MPSVNMTPGLRDFGRCRRWVDKIGRIRYEIGVVRLRSVEMWSNRQVTTEEKTIRTKNKK